MNGSISLLRTNPALTTNVKIVVDSQYNLYLESYSANTELSDIKYKQFVINADSFISQRIATFYNNLPTNIAFDVKNDIKSDVIQSDFNRQFDDIYYSGARNVEDTRYAEEFQYNTTLKIVPNSLPKYFMIFRIDEPGVENIIINADTVDTTQNYLYVSDYINKLKLIQSFDLTPKTNIGLLWKKNYIDDEILPRSPIELNFKRFEFSTWNGYDYYTGGIVSKSFFMDDYMQNQTTPFEFESFLTDGFKKNAVISAHYSNISFLYNDTVAGVYYNGSSYYEKDYPFIISDIQAGNILSTQYTKAVEHTTNLVTYTFLEHVPYRKRWTINRYTGFYIDEILQINKISPYIPVKFNINQGIYLINNVFYTANDITSPSINPVNGIYDAQLPIYFKIGTDLFLVEFQNNQYVLISTQLYNGLIDDFINNAQLPIKIEYLLDSTANVYRNYIKYTDNTYFNDITIISNKNSLYLIYIIDKYYSLKLDNSNNIYIDTDEYILCDSTKVTRQLSFNPQTIDGIQVLTKDNTITYFTIYQLQFTDISDLDFQRTNTKYAQREYNKNDNVLYARPLLTMLNVKDTNIPQDYYYEKYYNIWLYNTTLSTETLLFTNTYILPLASEYAASGDLYMLDKTFNLTRIWDINQSVAKWGIYNSINNMSYPYSINNSLDVCGPYNFTPDGTSSYPHLSDLSLDWFYSFGKPVNYDITDYSTLQDYTNYSLTNITERSLNIDMPNINTIDPSVNILDNYIFDITYYKNNNAVIDYFDYILNLPVILTEINPTSDIQGNANLLYYKRIAYFTQTDNVNGPSVFFKGLNVYAQYVQTNNPNTNYQFKTTPANDIVGYGFSVLYSPRFTNDINLLGKAGIEIILNKIYKNILVNIYVYTLPGTFTTLDYRCRDDVYNDKYIMYTNWDNPSIPTALVFYKSELSTQALTLKTFNDILTNNSLIHPNFSCGIKYTVIDNIIKYPIANFSAIYDISDNVSTVTITFNIDLPFKQGDWIFLSNTVPTLASYNKNIQISTKINNRTITIVIGGNQTSVMSTLNTNLNNIICTSEQSVYPFRLQLITPEQIKLNKSINLVLGDTSCPVKPRNNFSVNSDILIYDNEYTNILPNIYVDDNISRMLQKVTLNKELSYSDIDKLPYIYRYGGDFEPILNQIDLFDKASLVCYNNKIFDPTMTGNFTQPATIAQYIEVTQINNLWYVSLHIEDYNNQLFNSVFNTCNINLNDIFYISESSSTYSFLDFKTAHIIDISVSTISTLSNAYKITLSIPFLLAPITNITVGNALVANDITIYLFKYHLANTTFQYNYKNFGKTNDLIIAKEYVGINPLQTSADVWNTTNKYPMIDEHGVTVINRNLFKSSWDINFYYKTVSNKYTNI